MMYVNRRRLGYTLPVKLQWKEIAEVNTWNPARHTSIFCPIHFTYPLNICLDVYKFMVNLNEFIFQLHLSYANLCSCQTLNEIYVWIFKTERWRIYIPLTFFDNLVTHMERKMKPIARLLKIFVVAKLKWNNFPSHPFKKGYKQFYWWCKKAQ